MRISQRCAGVILLCLASHAYGHERELILAGGALRTCSSLSARECVDPALVTGASHRQPSRYVFDTVGVNAAVDSRLWTNSMNLRTPLARVLADAQTRHGDAVMDAAAAAQTLATRCSEGANVVACPADDARAPWSRLDDDMQAAVLAAIEQPQLGVKGARRREVADIDGSRSPHGTAIWRAFVAAARKRAGSEIPRIAVVTAPAFDPFDPVDFYLDALRDAGAQPQWWPVDAALAAAMFEQHDCAAISAARLSLLRLPGRERVYPDLVAQQVAACGDPDALARVPDEVHGIFFAGGDQWKLRRAFFDADDRPNPWLLALRRAAFAGRVVIGGTSAGSAAQSGGPMLSNGTPLHALRHAGVAIVPPAPGCTRSGDCSGALDEDAMTYWRAGGLGLASEMIVDTHFSERAREVRLVRLLADTGSRWGLGADEASALHLRWRRSGAIQVEALGAAGGWVLHAVPSCTGATLRAQAHYLAAGAITTLRETGVEVVVDAGNAASKARSPPRAVNALAEGALRDAAQRLASGMQRVQMPAGPDGAIATLARTPDSRAWRAPGAKYAGISAMTLEIAKVGDCDGDDASGTKSGLPAVPRMR